VMSGSRPRTLKAPVGRWFSCFTEVSAPRRWESRGQEICGLAPIAPCTKPAAASMRCMPGIRLFRLGDEGAGLSEGRLDLLGGQMLGQVVSGGRNAGSVLGRQVLAAGQDQPTIGGSLALGHALSMAIDNGEAKHGVGVALLRGPLVPLAGLGEVGWACAAAPV